MEVPLLAIWVVLAGFVGIVWLIGMVVRKFWRGSPPYHPRDGMDPVKDPAMVMRRLFSGASEEADADAAEEIRKQRQSRSA